MEAKHTRAPWWFNPNPSQDHGQFIIEGPDGEEIAAVMAWIDEHHEEAKANAHLIAAAAELLERLAQMVAVIGNHDGVDLNELLRVYDASRRTIAKATGDA